ncbi:MAG: HD domain-containing phosphohydrolase [Thermodesulfobacteriota bacterium]
MSLLVTLLTTDRLKRLLGQYSEAFGRQILILDEEEKALLSVHGDRLQGKLTTRPLYLRDSLVGYVATAGDEGDASQLEFIARNLMEMINAGYEIDSLAGEVARVYEELSLLANISAKLGSGLEVDRICRVLADEVMKRCPSANVSIMLVKEVPRDESPQSGMKSFLVPRVSIGKDADKASTMILKADTGLIGYVSEIKRAITVCDVSEEERFEPLPYPVARILLVPLVVEDTVIGAVVANDKLDGEEFYSPEIKLLSNIASECAISIKKALLYDEIHSMLFSMAEAFSLAIDAKDPYTYGHSKRVSRLAVGIAEELGLPPDTVDWIRLATLLHDTGKIGVPDAILNKADKLEPDEMLKMQEHPALGAKMIGHIQRFTEIARWIRHHHEHYDGSGYPMGLKGDDIPLPARIINVSDTFDALTSTRSYRKAMEKEEALKIMRDSSGTHVDPAILDCLEKVLARS